MHPAGNKAICTYKQECIPVGCVPPTRYRTGGGLPNRNPPLDRDPPVRDPRSETPLLDKDPTPVDRETPVKT